MLKIMLFLLCFPPAPPLPSTKLLRILSPPNLSDLRSLHPQTLISNLRMLT